MARMIYHQAFDVEVLRSKINSLLKRREEMKRFYAGSGNTVTEGEVASKKDDSPSNLFMESVISTIEKHLDDPSFEAKVLADSLNMSLPTLYRKIKLHSDSSILGAYPFGSLEKAAELISMQRYSIQEVSEMVGFNDTATFRKRLRSNTVSRRRSMYRKGVMAGRLLGKVATPSLILKNTEAQSIKVVTSLSDNQLLTK